jgi:hypothetical protein
VYTVLDRYLEKNSPPGRHLALRAEYLDTMMGAALEEYDPERSRGASGRGRSAVLGRDTGDRGDPDAGDAGLLSRFAAFRSAEERFQELIRMTIPQGLHVQYYYSHSEEELAAFEGLLGTVQE